MQIILYDRNRRYCSNAYFSFDMFKQYFKIKTHKDLLNKITEVFSFNNDISQRRSLHMKLLGLIIRKNQIILPDQAITTKKTNIA